MVIMISDQLEMKSIRNYGLQGALGLLMGIGAGLIPGFILIMLISSLSSEFIPVLQGAVVLVTILAIYSLSGFYTGYIFGGQKKSPRTALTYAAAGVFGGLVTAGLYAWGFIFMRGDSSPYLIPLFFTLAFTGPVMGFPKIRKMIIMTISNASGAALGYGIFVTGEYIAVYINNVMGLLAIFIAIPFSLLAIGIAGASITTGMYFAEGNAYTAREIPGFLKKARSTGIAVTLIVLFFSALMFFNVAKYATTDVSIDLTGDGKLTVFVPVILENGTEMEMYGSPAISGNASTEFINTDHGKAFKISGSGSTRINLKQAGGLLATDPEANEKFINVFLLSTSNATNYGNSGGHVDAWVYSEEKGTKFKFSIIRDNGWGNQITIKTEKEVNLIRGWQEVSLSTMSMWYD